MPKMNRLNSLARLALDTGQFAACSRDTENNPVHFQSHISTIAVHVESTDAQPFSFAFQHLI
jgi:hypothetical protein